MAKLPWNKFIASCGRTFWIVLFEFVTGCIVQVISWNNRWLQRGKHSFSETGIHHISIHAKISPQLVKSASIFESIRFSIWQISALTRNIKYQKYQSWPEIVKSRAKIPQKSHAAQNFAVSQSRESKNTKIARFWKSRVIVFTQWQNPTWR